MEYEKLGLKCGLEIHQQLEGRKLFCGCSTSFREKEEVISFRRKMKAVEGESGHVDAASKYEQVKDKSFIYHGYKGEVCSVDCDEELPLEVDPEALKTALSLAKMLRMNIPDYIYVMRKNITDGSVCSSYQRTMVVGLESKDSFLETSHGPVKINQLVLEEDSCKIMKKGEREIHYSLSRQGIPLIEITTNPDIKNPEQAKEAAEKLGSILRSFPNMKRGIGTIRQDVNLSIRGGARVEIKGFQDLRTMPKVIENEVERQLSLIKQKKKVLSEVRNANPDGTTSYLRPMPGASRLYPETDQLPVVVDHDILKGLKTPELLTDRIARLSKRYSIPEELTKELINTGFEDYVKRFNRLKPVLIAQVLTLMLKDVKRRFDVDISNITESHIEDILKLLDEGKIGKDAVTEIYREIAANPSLTVTEVAKRFQSNGVSLEKVIMDAISKNKDALGKPTAEQIIMGIVMKEVRGKVPGNLVMESVRKIISEMKG